MGDRETVDLGLESEARVDLVPFRWPRPYKETVCVKYGFIWPFALSHEPSYRDRYDPFECRQLPSALARVQNESQAVRFVSNYGLLGYSKLIGAPSSGPILRDFLPGYLKRFGEEGTMLRNLPFDPLSWFLAQARTVRFALDLISALEYDHTDRLLSVLEERRIDVEWDDDPPWDGAGPIEPPPMGLAAFDGRGGAYGAYELALGPEVMCAGGPYDFLLRVYANDGDRPTAVRIHAYRLLAEMVNENTKGIHQGLQTTKRGLALSRTATALIEVIWYLVGEAALLVSRGMSREERPAQGIRMCEECGLPFVVTDRRQRFCPPDFGSKSLCATRARQRRLRERRLQEAQQKRVEGMETRDQEQHRTKGTGRKEA